jgi:hypothetical protein
MGGAQNWSVSMLSSQTGRVIALGLAWKGGCYNARLTGRRDPQ